MSVLERTQVLRASRIGRADLRRLNGEMCLSKTTTRQEIFVYGCTESTC